MENRPGFCPSSILESHLTDLMKPRGNSSLACIIIASLHYFIITSLYNCIISPLHKLYHNIITSLHCCIIVSLHYLIITSCSLDGPHHLQQSQVRHVSKCQHYTVPTRICQIEITFPYWK